MRLLLRADGNTRIGLGHVMRLLALAEILRPDFPEQLFLIREPDATLSEQITAAGLLVHGLPACPLPDEATDLATRILRPDDVLVLDGYDFRYDYQNTVRGAVHRLAYLDDLHVYPLAADLVLNPAGGLTPADYDLRQPGARLLSGPAYAPLRAAFQHDSTTDSAAEPDPSSVFVCLGGADPTHQTRHVAAGLLALPGVRRVHAVVGTAYQGWDALKTWAADQSNLTLYRHLAAPELAALMRQCGAAVCSASTVSYEYCAAGGGLLLLLPTAANQHDLDHYLRAAGLARPYAAAANILTSPEAGRLASQMQVAQRAVFDGQAPARLRKAFRELTLVYSLILRRATPADVTQYFDWANDADVRRNAVHPEPIEWEAHRAWFGRRLADSDTLLYYFEQAGQPVGQVRVEFTGSEGLIDYSVAAGYRGRGLGLAILRRALLALRTDRMAPWTLVAQVKAGNLPSRRVFERLGFAPQTAIELRGAVYDVFRLAFTPPL